MRSSLKNKRIISGCLILVSAFVEIDLIVRLQEAIHRGVLKQGEKEKSYSSEVPSRFFIRNVTTNSPIVPILRNPVPNVFYIAPTKAGGSLKYINDLEKHYEPIGLKFASISNKTHLSKCVHLMKKDDILFFQHNFFTDFTFDLVQDLVLEYELRLVVPIHDLYFITKNVENRTAGYWVHFGNYSLVGEMPQGQPRNLLEMAEAIVFPSRFIHDKFKEHLSLERMYVVPHIDFLASYKECMPVLGEDGTINIGIITDISLVKGSRVLKRLISDVNEKLLNVVTSKQEFRNPPLENRCFKKVFFHIYGKIHINKNDLIQYSNVIVHPSYLEGGIFDIMVEDQIHGIVMLNEAPETYSYALTKAFESGLPILYSEMGAVWERARQREIPNNKKSMYIGTNNIDVYERFLDLLSIVCAGNHMRDTPCKNLPPEERPLRIPKFYDKLFFGDHSSIHQKNRSKS